MTCGLPASSAREHAALALASLVHSGLAVEVAREGAVPPLVKLLSDGSPNAKGNAALALLELTEFSYEDKNYLARAAQIVAEGGVLQLIALMASGTPEAKQHAAGALRRIATCDAASAARIEAEGSVPPLIALLVSGTPKAKQHAVCLLKTLTDLAVWDTVEAEKHFHILDDVVGAGAVPPLVAMLTGDLSTEAAEALKNLSVRSRARCDKIVAEGAVPHLFAMLASPKTKDYAAGVLLELEKSGVKSSDLGGAAQLNGLKAPKRGVRRAAC